MPARTSWIRSSGGLPLGSRKKPSKATARSRLPRAQSRRERKASRPESWPSRSSSQVGRVGADHDVGVATWARPSPRSPSRRARPPSSTRGRRARCGSWRGSRGRLRGSARGGRRTHPPQRLAADAQAMPESRLLQRIAPNGCSRSRLFVLIRIPHGICVLRRANSIRGVSGIRIQDTLSGEVRELEPERSRRGRDLRLRSDGLRADPHRQRHGRSSSSRCCGASSRTRDSMPSSSSTSPTSTTRSTTPRARPASPRPSTRTR